MDTDLFRDIPEQLCCEYEPGSVHWVHITHITNPHDFYVRATKYYSHVDHLETILKTSDENIEPKIRQLVALQTTQARNFIRGEIVAINETELSKSCDVFTLDYGSVEKEVPFEYIFKCDENVAQVPPLALHCRLYMCAPKSDGWSFEAIDAFKYYVGEEKAKMIIKHIMHGKLIVQLINTCPDDISTLLAMSGFSTLGYVDNMVSRVPSTSAAARRYFYNFKERERKETLHVRMLYGRTLDEFYVAVVDEYKDFLNLMDDINFHAKKQRSLKQDELVIGRPVLILEEQPLRSSQRAVIESVFSKSEATVCFVDNGKKVVAQLKNIKIMADECLKHPAIAIYCSTQDLPRGIYLQDFILPGFEFMITIEQLGSELKSPHIVKVSLI